MSAALGGVTAAVTDEMRAWQGANAAAARLAAEFPAWTITVECCWGCYAICAVDGRGSLVLSDDEDRVRARLAGAR